MQRDGRRTIASPVAAGGFGMSITMRVLLVTVASAAFFAGCEGTDALSDESDPVVSSASAIAEERAGGEMSVPDHGRGGHMGLRLDCTAPAERPERPDRPADAPPPGMGGPRGGP